MGVRKRLSEESLRNSYRLNGVPSGSAVARCNDRFGRWEYGYVLGVIVRKTASVVQIRWADEPDYIKQYSQGDARYEVDRNRWRILGRIQGNPLDPDNPLAVALTGLMGSGIMGHRQNADDSTDRGDEEDMTKQSKAAQERQMAQAAAKTGQLQERDTYTAKQVATRCGTDAKTMRKFFRSNHSTVEPVGQGGRYEFDAKDFPKIKREFDTWTARAQKRAQSNGSKKLDPAQVKEAARKVAEESEFSEEEVEAAILDQEEQELAQAVRDHFGDDDHEPTPEELEEMARVMAENDIEELDLDDLDGDEI